MNWLTNFVRPKIQALINRPIDIPENLWTKCVECEHMLFQRDLEKNLFVCHHCQYHFKLGVAQRLSLIFDNGTYTETPTPKVVPDPLRFRDSKKYADRLKEYRHKTQKDDCVVVAYGTIGGHATVVACFNFAFMGGSMGMAAGQALIAASDLAIKTRSAFVAIAASGGARMQEGILSLMQMPRTIIAVERVKEACLPYITVLTNPTTGGVSASFAMLGDIAFAEPGAIIGFAGARVIKETIKQDLPKGFQKSEYLLDHGMIDQVVHRRDLKATLSQALGLLFHHFPYAVEKT